MRFLPHLPLNFTVIHGCFGIQGNHNLTQLTVE